MSRSYCFDITFDLEFNPKNIEIILKKGSQKGFLYFTFDSVLKRSGRNFTDQEATDYLLFLYGNEDEDDKTLYVKYRDTAINIRVGKNNENHIIFEGDFSYVWEKKFSNNEYNDPDFARYILLLVDVYREIGIKKLETQIIY